MAARQPCSGMLHHHRPPAAKSATIMALVLCCLGLGLLFLSPTSLAVKVDQFRSPATDARWQNPAQLQPAAATPVDAQAATTVHSSLLQQADRHQLVETQTQGFGANLANFAKSAAKGAASAVLNSVAGGTGGTGSPIASILPRPTPAAPSPLGAEDIENCVACRYIWLQVEMVSRWSSVMPWRSGLLGGCLDNRPVPCDLISNVRLAIPVRVRPLPSTHRTCSTRSPRSRSMKPSPDAAPGPC